MPAKPSQRDVARLAGVSQATVSMVLNGRASEYNVSRETADRVRSAMTDLQYVPNIAGRSLRKGRNGLIGVYTYESVFPVRSNDYYHEFLIGIEEAAVEHKQDLVLFASTQRHDGTRRIYGDSGNRLRLADGSVIFGSEPSTEELQRLADEGYPFVFIGRRDFGQSPVPYVAGDYTGAVATVVERLHASGHRNVAYIGRPERLQPQTERYEAFRTSIDAYADSSASAIFPDPDELSGSTIREVLKSGSTAVVIESADLALSFAQAAENLAVTIPEDLSVVLLDAPPDALGHWSHIGFDRRAMGAKAVELLLKLLNGEISRDHHEVVTFTPSNTNTISFLS